MSLTLIAIAVIVVLTLGYTLYGQLVARQYALDDSKTTPAVLVNDGVDFVPTKRFFLLGQHFSAIAAAGPIAGPILACQLFGWGPSLLWIALGVVFIGAVHDFSALVASVRHKARSVAEIVKENLGRRAWFAIMAFIWIALVYLVIAFADITAATFVGKTEELEGAMPFNKGGAVAFASTAYLLLSIVMGLIQRKWDPPLWLMTVIFVPATLVAVWAGTQFSTLLIASQTSWGVIIMVYCFVASLLPVWMLLQPRGYLGGFVLYMALAVGLIGIFFGGFEIKQPMTTAAPTFGFAGSAFPFLFVTIACGACSGFHGLVASGTTSKQIAKESDCKPVGYGAMLLEAFVAVIALATIMIVAPDASKGVGPGRIYGDGIASFLTVLIGKDAFIFAATFGAMAFSTFVFDTLDVATRLGRYILQELTNAHGRTAAIVATAITAAVPALVLVAAGPGGYRTFWTLFGTSNQLLAALTLLGISVWLHRSGKRYWFTFAPMVFLMFITVWSLVGQTIQFVKAASAATGAAVFPQVANASVAVLLFALTAFLVFESSKVFSKPPVQVPAARAAA
ncbi:MAG TPA: carbon starvation CstA family protein [Candidatus Eisenbacteria bacterium]|nr:carbon starvation CstA family protein [Candidatus Eisenbacteria bacterium]